MCDRGCAWRGCAWGGGAVMCGRMSKCGGGHAWWGSYVAGGMHGRGHVWWGMCGRGCAW